MTVAAKDPMRQTWAGELPSDWDNWPLKFAATLRNIQAAEEDAELPYVGLENIEARTGRLIRVGSSEEQEPTGGKRFNKGQVLFSKLRPYLAKAFVAESDGRCTGELLVFDPMRFHARFLNYFMISDGFVKTVDSSTYGSKMPRAEWDFIGRLRLPLPSIDTQTLIARFLDRETAEIDELVAEKEKMLGILEEKRAALIARAVTRGIDPKAKMKPSGIDWLGSIPEGWRTERAKHLFDVRDERSDTGTEELLTVSHLTGVTPRAEKDVFMFKADSLEGYKKCGPGDLAINTLWAWMGAMGVARQDGIVSPDYHVYRLGPHLDPDYVDYLCRSGPFVAEVNRHSKGVWSSRLRLYPEAFFQIVFPVPPLEDQRSIVRHLDAELCEATELAAGLRDSIRLLGERRAAVITAAVTGKIAPPDASMGYSGHRGSGAARIVGGI